MKFVLTRLPAAARAATLVLAIAGPVLHAQGTVTGRVTGADTKAPLSGARVMVLGGTATAITNDEGRYTLRQVAPGNQQIQVLRVGYASKKQTITLEAGATITADFELAAAVVQLQEVVTTATGQQRRVELGNSVSNLGDVSKRVETSQISDLAGLVIAKSPGVVVLPQTTLGGAPTFRIRGVSSISLSNAPIYYVDGVRYSANTLQSGTDTQFSLLNTLNPEEIEDIEIVKGPSAATLYGTNAANGVVLITTKRGRAGTTRWNWSVEQGRVSDRVDYPDQYANWGHAPGSTTPIRCQLATMTPTTCISDSLTHYNWLRDPDNTFVAAGSRSLYGLNVSGGTDIVRFFTSADYDAEIGPIKMPWYEVRRFDSLKVGTRPEWRRPLAQERMAFRANVNAAVSPKLDLAVNTGYARLYNRIMPSDDLIDALLYVGIQNYGFKGPGLDKVVNQADGTPLHDAFTFAPGDIMQRVFESTVNRFTASTNAGWRPFSWMQNDGTVGIDLSMTNFFNVCRLNECAPRNATARQGIVTDNRFNLRNFSAKLSSTSTWNVRSWLNLKTSVGGDYTNLATDSARTTGSTLPPGASTVAAAATRNASQAQPTAVKTLGLYVQEQVGLRDRLFATMALRTDQNSAFGTNFQEVYYPKFSVSWILSDEPLFPAFSWLNSFRFRSAFGASGVQPGATAALGIFTPASVSISGRNNTTGTDTPGLTANQTANPDLRPERSTELETGFETQLINNRLRLDYTYYTKKTRDALIQVNLAPSSGAAQLNPLQNIGSTKNWGHEFQMNAQLFDTRPFAWDVLVSASHNSNKVLDLGIDPNTGKPRFLRTSSGSTSGEVRQIPGYPINSVWYRPYTYRDANGDGILQVSEVQVDSAFQYFGYRTPRDLVSVQSGVEFLNRTLRVSALFDYKGGHGALDGANNFQCTTGPFACRETQDRAAPLDMQARAIAKTYGTLIGTTTFKTARGYFTNNQFWKFRELSVAYTLPARALSRIRAQNGSSVVVAARNLHTWSKWPGIDPEANYGLTQTEFQSEFQTNGAPTYVTFRLNLKY